MALSSTRFRTLFLILLISAIDVSLAQSFRDDWQSPFPAESGRRIHFIGASDFPINNYGEIDLSFLELEPFWNATYTYGWHVGTSANTPFRKFKVRKLPNGRIGFHTSELAARDSSADLRAGLADDDVTYNLAFLFRYQGSQTLELPLTEIAKGGRTHPLSVYRIEKQDVPVVLKTGGEDVLSYIEAARDQGAYFRVRFSIAGVEPTYDDPPLTIVQPLNTDTVTLPELVFISYGDLGAEPDATVTVEVVAKRQSDQSAKFVPFSEPVLRPRYVKWMVQADEGKEDVIAKHEYVGPWTGRYPFEAVVLDDTQFPRL